METYPLSFTLKCFDFIRDFTMKIDFITEKMYIYIIGYETCV